MLDDQTIGHARLRPDEHDEQVSHLCQRQPKTDQLTAAEN